MYVSWVIQFSKNSFQHLTTFFISTWIQNYARNLIPTMAFWGKTKITSGHHKYLCLYDSYTKFLLVTLSLMELINNWHDFKRSSYFFSFTCICSSSLWFSLPVLRFHKGVGTIMCKGRVVGRSDNLGGGDEKLERKS